MGNRPPKPKPENPITLATRQWLAAVSGEVDFVCGDDEGDALLQQAPKRFTIYEPMLLLPTGSFQSQAWCSILSGSSLDESDIARLWTSILHQVSLGQSSSLTHLAVNEGIPIRTESPDSGSCGAVSTRDRGLDNVLRSPSGLRMLYGDFGPAQLPPELSTEDFSEAFWVRTKQNGIRQVWAPRWTMFSRGNVKEKARLLGFHDDPAWAQRVVASHEMGEKWAVDMYAGIGYFAFSYAKLGLRVLCWELNPWSVEALRRGAQENGWQVKVVEGADLSRPSAELFAGREQIIVFLENNEKATGRLWEVRESGILLDILHVNGGLLPTSERTWRSCWEMTRGSALSWFHLHENVGGAELDGRRAEIQTLFDEWAAQENQNGIGSRIADVEHVELVKTYAPNVWHCVFDVYIKTNKI